MKEYRVLSLAEPVGNLWKELQGKNTKGDFLVAAPLSSTPIPICEWIIDHADEFEGWNKMRFVLMDEQVEQVGNEFEYVSIDDPASYEKFAQEKFLRPLSTKIALVNDVVLKPDLKKFDEFNKRIDLLILALGVQGNYANVMPGTSEETGWHIAKLLDEFKQAHTQKGSQSYEGAKFRNYGMSLGPQQVLEAENVVVIISGEKKRELAKQLLSYKSFDSEFPLSVIYHPQVRDRVSIYMTEDVLG
ncbi:MAG TPA: 6-phosphogluconolactonase [Patescibacteria group bacterium]|nr:6-phosphogluconolactonase [Patescibacteria group bacterium]